MEFRIERWIKLGDLSPKLFNRALEDIFRRLNWEGKGIRVSGDYINNLRYADDILLIEKNTTELEDVAKKLIVKCREAKWKFAGLMVTEEGTKWDGRVQNWVPLGNKRRRGRPTQRWRDEFVTEKGPPWQREAWEWAKGRNSMETHAQKWAALLVAISAKAFKIKINDKKGLFFGGGDIYGNFSYLIYLAHATERNAEMNFINFIL